MRCLLDVGFCALGFESSDRSRGSESSDCSARSESLDVLGCSDPSNSSGRSGSSGFLNSAEIMTVKGARMGSGFLF